LGSNYIILLKGHRPLALSSSTLVEYPPQQRETPGGAIGLPE